MFIHGIVMFAVHEQSCQAVLFKRVAISVHCEYGVQEKDIITAT